MSDFEFGSPAENDFELDVPADFNGGQDAEGNEDYSIPDGPYRATLVGFANHTSNAGNSGFKLEFKIQNRPTPSRYPETYYVGKDAKSQERLAKTLAALNCPKENGRFKLKELSDLLGQEVTVHMVKDAPYNGKVRSKVKFISKAED